VIILAIIVLFIISLALRVASSGVSTLQKVNDRAIKIGSKVTMKATDKAADASSKALSKATPSNSSKINKTKNTVKRGKNSAIKAGSKGVQVMNKAVGKSTVLVLLVKFSNNLGLFDPNKPFALFLLSEFPNKF